MTDFGVVPNPTGGWDAEREGASRASSHHSTQSEAQKAATYYADNSGGGEVRVYGRDGRILNPHTTGRSDPNPPQDKKH